MKDVYINVDGWFKIPEATKGSRGKQWISKPIINAGDPAELFLFKESIKRYPAEFWAEIIASHLGKLIGIETPETWCAQFENKYGALVKFFLSIEWDNKNERYLRTESLLEGGDIIMDLDPTFDRKKGQTHNINLVAKVFLNLNKKELLGPFYRILIFDAIIGNTDRHQDNWGFIRNNKTGDIKLAPAYDNSTSLGSELLESKLAGYLEESDVNLIKYIKKGKSHIRWSKNGKDLERVNHFQFLRNIAQENSEISRYVAEITNFSDDLVDSILSDLAQIRVKNPIFLLSTSRMKLIKRIICLRRDLLKKEFEL